MWPEAFEAGRRARWEGDLPEAKRRYTEALAAARNPVERAKALCGVGQIDRDMGDIAEAKRLYIEAVALYREHGAAQQLAHAIRHVADMDRITGQCRSAEPAYREALAIYRAEPDTPPLDLANLLNGFTALLASTGQTAEAVPLTEEARDLYASLNLQPGVDDCVARLASMAG